MDSKLSKSHILGVMDAYWSDDEGEDTECPLCMDQMDISDMGFKPCPCGYQICSFCWHHIKENLNGRCPACRRVYTEDAVQFKAMNPEDVRRINQQKKTKEKERKELEALGRKALANMRVVQRNVVYITGVGPRFAREELISTLRSNEYFGQYGKITKILLVKRTPPAGGEPVVGLYVTYYRREDASRCITAVDGTPSPSGNGEVIRASYGTTKYCIAFLRGVGCSNKGCLELHEWGDEKDCFTKEDLSTLKHTMKESESRPRKQDEPEGLPKKPTWITSGTSSRQPASLSATRQSVPNVTTGRRPATASQATTTTTARQRTTKTTTTNESTPVVRRDKDKERTKRPSSAVAPGRTQAAGGSRPSSPAVQAIARASTPAAESDQGSSVADSANSPRLEHMSTKATRAGPPPGIPDPSTTKASVQTPPPGFAPVQKAPSHERAPSSSSYQPSTAAQALLDDFRSRRERSSNQTDGSSITGFSPFPDFERTLKNLGLGPSDDGDGGLKFSFDFNIDDDAKGLLDPASDPFFEPEPLRTQTTNVIASPYSGSFNPFEAPPSQPPEHSGWTSAPAFSGFGIPSNTPILSQATIPQASYRGSFDPFADSEPAARPSPAQSYGTPVEGERTSSRFGFARRPTPAGRSSAIQTGRDSVRGSPLVSSPADALPSSPFVSTLDVIAPRPSTQVPHAHWSTGSAPSRPESTQTGPPGLTGPASTSISLSQLFGSNYARRNSLRSVDSGLSPPPGLGAPPRVGADSVTRGLAGSIHDPGGFVDPAIMRTGPAPPGLSLATEQRSLYSTNPPAFDVASPSLHSSAQMESSVATPSESISDDPFASRMRSQSRSNPSATSSVVGSSIPPTPLHALPATTISSSPPTSAVEEVIESPKFQASDFPALSGPANGETSTREPQAPVAAAPKVAKGPRVTTKVEVKKDIPKRKNTLEAAPKVTPLTEEPKKEEKKKVSKATTKAAVVATSKVAPPEMTPAPAAAAANKGKEMPKEREKLEKAKPASKPAVNAPAEPEAQAPLLSRQSKKEKNKAKPKPAKAAPVEEIANEAPFVEVTGAASPVVRVMTGPDGGKGSPRGTHGSNTPYERTSISELLRVMDGQGSITLNDLNFFNSEKILPNTQAPLQYGPLVHALSALSVGGGTFSNNLPSRSIDTAVSSFQTLLETLTQTISDLLRLLPRTTWDDSSSFDGVLRDMLKGDDFFDDHGEDGSAKSDEVAALTQALERRARWMEVQLSKLEELHRDINTAAVQAVLSLNDRGWDNKGFLPHQGGSLARFEALPYRDGKGERQLLGIPELERKLERAQETERVVENDLRKSVDGMLLLKYQAQDEWSV